MKNREKRRKQGRKSKAKRLVEVSQLGPFKFQKSGNVVSMKNEMTDEQHAKYLEKAAADYTIVVNELLDTSRKIATKVSELEPLKLLKDAYWEHIHLQL